MDDDLQTWVAKAVRAEIGARSMTVRQLGILAGISDKVLRRALDGERLMSLMQLTRIAHALGLPVTYLVGEAERRRSIESGLTDDPNTYDARLADDPRALIQHLLANEDLDHELLDRLDKARSQSGVTGRNLQQLQAVVRQTRREELQRALTALPSTPQQDNGWPATGDG